MALRVAKAIGDKKGLEVRVLDVCRVCGFADFFVLATGASARHVRALADAAIAAALRAGAAPKGVEGKTVAGWVLVDLGDVVVHVFQEDERDFFGLERLWGDAEELAVERAVSAAS